MNAVKNAKYENGTKEGILTSKLTRINVPSVPIYTPLLKGIITLMPSKLGFRLVIFDSHLERIEILRRNIPAFRQWWEETEEDILAASKQSISTGHNVLFSKENYREAIEDLFKTVKSENKREMDGNSIFVLNELDENSEYARIRLIEKIRKQKNWELRTIITRQGELQLIIETQHLNDLVKLLQERLADFAMRASTSNVYDYPERRKGGIDFNSDKMNLQVKMDSRFRGNDSREGGNDRGSEGNDNGIKFKIDPAQLAQLQNAPGFVPVIINVQPLNNLKKFLGIDAF